MRHRLPPPSVVPLFRSGMGAEEEKSWWDYALALSAGPFNAIANVPVQAWLAAKPGSTTKAVLSPVAQASASAAVIYNNALYRPPTNGAAAPHDDYAQQPSVLPAGAPADRRQPSSMSTTTLVLVGGSALALFLLWRKK